MTEKFKKYIKYKCTGITVDGGFDYFRSGSYRAQGFIDLSKIGEEDAKN